MSNSKSLSTVFNSDHNIVLATGVIPDRHILQLEGGRLVAAAGKGEKFSAEQIKELTGGDHTGSRRYVEALIEKADNT